MLVALKRRIADGLLLAADIAGVVLAGSGAAVVAFFGKLMLAVVLGAIALGFFLRIVGRRQAQVVAPPPIPMWQHLASAALAAVQLAWLVEAANFPVRFDQAGFELWHWGLLVVALAVAYPLNLRLMGSLTRRRDGTAQP
jgi:hypothetical protein